MANGNSRVEDPGWLRLASVASSIGLVLTALRAVGSVRNSVSEKFDISSWKLSADETSDLPKKNEEKMQRALITIAIIGFHHSSVTSRVDVAAHRSGLVHFP